MNNSLSKKIILTIICLAVIIFISIPLAKNVSKQYQINNEIKELEKEIIAFESKNLELKDALKYFESDQFIQEQARINLNYKKEGEEVVIIKSLEEDLINKNRTKTIYNKNELKGNVSEEQTGNLTRWWIYFFLR